jgi:fumarate hydratase subunit beta
MMPSKVTNIQLPLSPKDAAKLKLGEIVSVSGRIFTGRSLFHIRAIEKNILPPLDFSAVNGFFHVGPVMRQEDGQWKIVSIEPTSSIRFERYGGDVIRKLNLRTVMGKTTMGRSSAAALRETGGVYLSKIGICGNQLAESVKKIETVFFAEELGKTEACWVFEVENFGPFFVAIDSCGRNYFEDLDAKIRGREPEILKSLGVPEGYSYTRVSPPSGD